MKTETIQNPTINKKPHANKDTKCFVCNNSIFKITRVTPEVIMLKCTKCNETHMIAAKATDNKVTPITFWDSDECY